MELSSYSSLDHYDAGKGFGPRGGPTSEKLVSSKKIPMQNRIPFKIPITGNKLHDVEPILPNFGMSSTTKSTYIPQTFSVMYSYLFQNGEEYGDSLSGPSAWQSLAPPGMYCTESCHIGTGWPINNIVDCYKNMDKLYHRPCFKKFEGYS